jgi:hypothetical protein
VRASEFLNEAMKISLKDFVLTISPHYFDQRNDRSVNQHRVDDILRNISRVKDSIRGLEPGRKFILHDGHGTGIGVGRGTGNNLMLNTTYKTGPGFVKGKYPTFRVDTYPNVKDVQ